MTRGIIESVDKMIRELSSQYLPFKMKGKDVKLQVRVSPVQLWDVSFPKEHEERMLNHLFPNGGTKSMSPKVNKFVTMLRMALGLKKIDNFKPTPNTLGILTPQNMDIFAIGKKADGVTKDPEGDYEAI